MFPRAASPASGGPSPEGGESDAGRLAVVYNNDVYPLARKHLRHCSAMTWLAQTFFYFLSAWMHRELACQVEYLKA